MEKGSLEGRKVGRKKGRLEGRKDLQKVKLVKVWSKGFRLFSLQRRFSKVTKKALSQLSHQRKLFLTGTNSFNILAFLIHWPESVLSDGWTVHTVSGFQSLAVRFKMDNSPCRQRPVIGIFGQHKSLFSAPLLCYPPQSPPDTPTALSLMQSLKHYPLKPPSPELFSTSSLLLGT